ncbi:hypothetical protein F8M41_007908 [Gigaspora margarita]|uniref:Uncharacterized protein n=1 Tax=Gigaspora margarita TaxID=4874 RepID=A0A8H4A424_GIGMA|nr:hypothetical protein F8M41_007908 [Gigaspora margarita]
MEFITIGSDDTYTEGSNNYESTDDYEYTYEKSETETPVIDLTEQISYSPFDNFREIRYSTLPIEYLPTSKEGIVIAFNIESWESYDAFFDNMQYQRGHPSGGGNTKVWCTFLDCDIHKYYSTCQVYMDTDLYQEKNAALDNQKSKEMQTYT